MTGVSATASRPSSAQNLVISKKFPTVKKFGANAEKNTISAASTSSSAHSPFGNQRRCHTLRHASCATCGSVARWFQPGDDSAVERMAEPIGRDRHQDDPALHRPLPTRSRQNVSAGLIDASRTTPSMP
jgi:hypothetical protein